MFISSRSLKLFRSKSSGGPVGVVLPFLAFFSFGFFLLRATFDAPPPTLFPECEADLLWPISEGVPIAEAKADLERRLYADPPQIDYRRESCWMMDLELEMLSMLSFYI